MRFVRDRNNGKLWLSQQKYIQKVHIEKVLERFNMKNSKLVSIPLAGHFKLRSKQVLTSENEKEEMQKIPYSSVIGSLMYARVCTRLDITHVVVVVSRFCK